MKFTRTPLQAGDSYRAVLKTGANESAGLAHPLTNSHRLVDLLIVTFAAALVTRLLLPPGFPATPDGEFHVFRVASYYELVRQGHWYPRWAPDMALGYGYPVYNFYPPLLVWVAAVFRTVGLSTVDATKAACAASVFIAGWGMYAFARGFNGRVGAVVAGVAYATNPYLLVDIYVRGAVGEAWGVALLPLVFASALHLANLKTFDGLCVAAIALAALLFTHNAVALIAIPLVLLFLVCATPSNSAPTTSTDESNLRLISLRMSRHHFAWSVGALAIGLALSAIFWLPALGEIRLVSTARLLEGAGDYRIYFHPLAHLVQDSIFYEYWIAEGVKVGLAQLGIAALGMAIGLLVPHLRRSTIYFSAMLITSLAMQTPASAPIWENVALLKYLQFPWRWLALTGLASACLAGILSTAIHRRLSHGIGWPVGTAISGLLVLTLAVTALFRLEGPEALAAGEIVTTTVLRQMERHRLSGAGLTAGEYLPKDRAAEPVDYIKLPHSPDVSRVPVRIRAHAVSPTRITLTAEPKEPGALIIDQLYFPGWEATVDGMPVSVQPFGALGLAAVEVPEGTHRVDIVRGLTPLQAVATGVSVGTAGLLALALLWRGRRAPRRHWRSLLLGVLVLGGFATTLLPPRVAAVSGPTAEFANGAQLAGWRVKSVPELEPTGITTFELFWTTLQPANGDFIVALRLLDEDGDVVGQRDQLPDHGLRPPRLWLPGLLVRDEQQIRLQEGVPAGRYRLALSIRRGGNWVSVAEGPRVSWHEGNGVAVTGVTLGEVDLGAAQPRQAPDLRHSAGVVFGDVIELASWEIEAPLGKDNRLADVEPGDTLRVRLQWRARVDPDDYAVFVHVHDHALQLLAQDDDRPRRGYAPTPLWHRGDEVIDEYQVEIPRDAAPGRYTLSVGWYNRLEIQNLPITSGSATGDRYVLGVVKVVPGQVEPEDAPDFRSVGVTFGERARLRGVVVEQPESYESGNRLRVTLYWEAVGGPWPDATVFVHLVDGGGKLVAQHDGPPMNGGFPLSIWSDDDVIADSHEIVLPAGVSPDAAQLAIGLYDSQTGARYTRDDGGDTVTVPVGER